MVTVAIVAILVMLAAPSYHNLVIDARMTSQSNEFLTNLQFTRSEAVKRNATVTMCKSSDVMLSPSVANPNPTCTTSGTWAQGWIIFVDGGTVGVFDRGVAGVPDDTLLRVHGALTDRMTLVGSANVANLVSYLPSGVSPQSGQWDLCSDDTSLPGRDIVLAAFTGSARVVVDAPPVTCS